MCILSLIDIGYNIAPAVVSSMLSSEPFNELQEMSYINLQPTSSLTYTNDENARIETVKDTFLQTSKMLTTSISDLQVINLISINKFTIVKCILDLSNLLIIGS